MKYIYKYLTKYFLLFILIYSLQQLVLYYLNVEKCVSTEEELLVFVDKIIDLVQKEPDRTILINLLLNDPNSEFIIEFNAIKKPTLCNFLHYEYAEFAWSFVIIIAKKGFMFKFPDTIDYYTKLYKNYVLLYNKQVDKCVIRVLINLYLQNKLPSYLHPLFYTFRSK